MKKTAAGKVCCKIEISPEVAQENIRKLMAIAHSTSEVIIDRVHDAGLPGG